MVGNLSHCVTWHRFTLGKHSNAQNLFDFAGRVSFFTSGSENTHFVEKLKSGTRYAITIAFTCDPDKSTSDPKIKSSWWATERNIPKRHGCISEGVHGLAYINLFKIPIVSLVPWVVLACMWIWREFTLRNGGRGPFLRNLFDVNSRATITPVSVFGWLFPCVLKQGWIYYRLRTFLASVMIHTHLWLGNDSIWHMLSKNVTTEPNVYMFIFLYFKRYWNKILPWQFYKIYIKCKCSVGLHYLEPGYRIVCFVLFRVKAYSHWASAFAIATPVTNGYHCLLCSYSHWTVEYVKGKIANGNAHCERPPSNGMNALCVSFQVRVDLCNHEYGNHRSLLIEVLRKSVGQACLIPQILLKCLSVISSTRNLIVIQYTK